MSGYVGSKLVVVEGLTGSGKSIMAQFIARQLQHNGIPASWVHEGDEPHPILIDVESGIEAYTTETPARWSRPTSYPWMAVPQAVSWSLALPCVFEQV